RRFPDGSFQLFRWLPAGRCSATGGGGPGCKSWFELSIKTRAGISYLFAAEMAILMFKGLGNGAIAAASIVPDRDGRRFTPRRCGKRDSARPPSRTPSAVSQDLRRSAGGRQEPVADRP